MEVAPAHGWEDLLDVLREEGGTALFLGRTDTGKSTLVRWLEENLADGGTATALVDADVGQSALCLPGTVGTKLFRSAADAREFTCDRFVFLGSPSPARIVFPLVETTGRLAEEARRETGLVLIDTTGLVTGELGLGLKLAKIRATGADRVIAVQREEECEPILERLGNIAIHRLPPSALARTRSQEARAERRNERLAAYFAAAPTEFIVGAGQADFFRLGREVSLRNIPMAEGDVIGLNHGLETVALGLVTEADRNGVSFRSPLRSVKEINRVVLGEISLRTG
jgi:polynucleotide 5'-hydroxyl-kinase GRC3/NOL9